MNYWGAFVVSSSETGRVFVTASVTGNVFEYDSTFLSAWSAAYLTYGNDPAGSSTPPTVTIGSGWSPEAPGPYGNPRFPWTVGSAITVNGALTPIFVDPAENVVTVQANSVELSSASGAVTKVSGPSGQVYAGVVNGAVVAPVIAAQTYDGQPYFPFNLDNLDVSVVPVAPPPPPPPPAPPPAALRGSHEPDGRATGCESARSFLAALHRRGLLRGRAKPGRRRVVGRRTLGDGHVLSRFRTRFFDDIQLPGAGRFAWPAECPKLGCERADCPAACRTGHRRLDDESDAKSPVLRHGRDLRGCQHGRECVAVRCQDRLGRWHDHAWAKSAEQRARLSSGELTCTPGSGITP